MTTLHNILFVQNNRWPILSIPGNVVRGEYQNGVKISAPISSNYRSHRQDTFKNHFQLAQPVLGGLLSNKDCVNGEIALALMHWSGAWDFVALCLGAALPCCVLSAAGQKHWTDAISRTAAFSYLYASILHLDGTACRQDSKPVVVKHDFSEVISREVLHQSKWRTSKGEKRAEEANIIFRTELVSTVRLYHPVQTAQGGTLNFGLICGIRRAAARLPQRTRHLSKIIIAHKIGRARAAYHK